MRLDEFTDSLTRIADANGASVKSERISAYYERFCNIEPGAWKRVCEHAQLTLKNYRDIPAIAELAQIVTNMGVWGVTVQRSDMMVFDCECGYSFAFSRSAALSTPHHSIRCPGHNYENESGSPFCHRTYEGGWLIKHSLDCI